MRVLVQGAGSVGLGLASFLIAGGADVDLAGRPDTVAELRRRGLRRSGIFGERLSPPDAFRAFADIRELPPAAEYDFALVCVKSFDTGCAGGDLAACPALVEGKALFVSCQNGWGNAEVLAEKLPRGRIRNARVITGFRRTALSEVEVTVHAEPVRVGDLHSGETADVEPLCAAIRRGGLPCEPTSVIGRDLWAKMLYNGVLNPLGAVLGVPYGALGESADTRRIMEESAREIFAVMRASGHSTHWKSADDYMRVFYEKHLPSTYCHESSMLQDVRSGRRTEIGSINGAVVRMAEELGIAVPCNRMLCELVGFLENGKEIRRRIAGMD